MMKIRLLLISFWLSIACPLKSQGQKVSVHIDTIPRISTFELELNLLDKIRCATYLFVRDFQVKDSVDKIYVNLYFDSTFLLLHERELPQKSKVVFQISYLFAFHDQIDVMKEIYKYMVVNICANNGEVLKTDYYEIKPHEYANTRIMNLNSIIRSLRVPATWAASKKHKRFETYFYCMDANEQQQFYRPLLLILHLIKFLDKKWKEWIGVYVDCTIKEKSVTRWLKLP